MTDIPEDVMKIAREVWSACMKADLGWSRSNPADVIARALLADRAAQAERMARLEEALRRLLKCEYDGQGLTDCIDNDGCHYPSQELADAIANAEAAVSARALSQEGSDA